MARNTYQYSTSPRKLEPEKIPQKNPKKGNLKVVKQVPKKQSQKTKKEKKKQIKLTLVVIGVFIVLLAISYRNSEINENFNKVQTLKKELSSLQKENEQLKVNIENSLNLNNIEQAAKVKLGMQKLTNKQKTYVNLHKKDYIESASEKVVIEKKANWFEQLISNIFKK